MGGAVFYVAESSRPTPASLCSCASVGADREPHPSLSPPLPRADAGSINVGGGKEDERDEKTANNEETKAGKQSAEKSTGSAKPNVFFILIDDMGYDDIGYQSTDLQGTTPNLDRLAAGGIKVMCVPHQH